MSIYRNLSTHTPNRNVAHVHYDSLCVPMLLQASPFDWCGCRRWQGRWKSEQNKEVFLRSDPSISFREKKKMWQINTFTTYQQNVEREKKVLLRTFQANRNWMRFEFKLSIKKSLCLHNWKSIFPRFLLPYMYVRECFFVSHFKWST